MTASPKLLVVQIAGLGYDVAQKHNVGGGMSFRPMDSVFPALTCPVQASFRTASLPSSHGVTANGFYDRITCRSAFWEQSARLVGGERIWAGFRARGRKVAMLFWQQSMGECADVVLSPAPIHKHHGGMIENVYGKPSGVYEKLCETVGRPFKLAQYWGPLASAESSQWIAEATAALIADRELAPDLCMTYLPALDYELQRCGPEGSRATTAIEALKEQLDLLTKAAAANGYEVLFFGDYAINACPHGAIYPNRLLYEKGLLRCRNIKGMLYPDYCESTAFALCDHEIAHVYLKPGTDPDGIAAELSSLTGIERVMGPSELQAAGLRHERCGDLLILARPGYWCAYPWWTGRGCAPEYGGHVDIHAKPGYDPCELFFGWPPGSVSRDASRVRGSHGRVDVTSRTCWASSVISGEVGSVVDLASRTRAWMDAN